MKFSDVCRFEVHTEKKYIRTRWGYWGQKTLAWLWKSQLEDKWRTVGWRWVSLQFLLFSPTLTPSLGCITCWCEKYTTFPFLLLHILTTARALKTFFHTAHNAPSLIHLQRHFPSEGAPPTIELSWRENFSSNEGWKKIIYFIEKFSKAKSLFLLLSLWCAKNSLSFNWHNARIMFWHYSKERSNVREKMRLRLIMEKKNMMNFYVEQYKHRCNDLAQVYFNVIRIPRAVYVKWILVTFI